MERTRGYVRSVDEGLITGEDERVVQEDAELTTDNGRQNGAPDPVLTEGSGLGQSQGTGNVKGYVLSEREHLSAVDHRGEQARTEVTSRVDGVTGLHTEGDTDHQDEQEDGERDETGWRGTVASIRQSANANEEHHRAEELIIDARAIRHVSGLGVTYGKETHRKSYWQRHSQRKSRTNQPFPGSPEEPCECDGCPRQRRWRGYSWRRSIQHQ